MIKANELRIGNWVVVDNLNQKVRGVFEDEILVQFRERETEYVFLNAVSPIPLTPEILEKCGLYQNLTKDAWWDKEEGILIGDENGRLFYGTWTYDKNNNPCVDEICELKFLHQLQNLYFALNQTELQITL